MSHGVTNDVVKLLLIVGQSEDADSDIAKLSDPEGWLLDNNQNGETTVEVRGWTWSGDWCRLGKRGKLWGYMWKKGDHTVLCWNSSPYSNAGYFALSATAADEPALEMFKSDTTDLNPSDSFMGKIEHDEVCEYWY